MKRILVIMWCALFAISTTSAQETTKKKEKETVTFFIENMECENCIKKIEKNIAFEKGVTDLKCNLSTRTVEVTYRADKTDVKKLMAAFDKIDKKAAVLKDGEKPETKHDGHKHKH
ncbi:MAG: heavy-metal-associated domain-containing protein [Tannerella sp.]|jgi:copper chaperone CopZ|nr:heavy-metal-associated domain-containing protein [Tannerella sp.]